MNCTGMSGCAGCSNCMPMNSCMNPPMYGTTSCGSCYRCYQQPYCAASTAPACPPYQCNPCYYSSKTPRRSENISSIYQLSYDLPTKDYACGPRNGLPEDGWLSGPADGGTDRQNNPDTYNVGTDNCACDLNQETGPQRYSMASYCNSCSRMTKDCVKQAIDDSTATSNDCPCVDVGVQHGPALVRQQGGGQPEDPYIANTQYPAVLAEDATTLTSRNYLMAQCDDNCCPSSFRASGLKAFYEDLEGGNRRGGRPNTLTADDTYACTPKTCKSYFSKTPSRIGGGVAMTSVVNTCPAAISRTVAKSSNNVGGQTEFGKRSSISRSKNRDNRRASINEVQNRYHVMSDRDMQTIDPKVDASTTIENKGFFEHTTPKSPSRALMNSYTDMTDTSDATTGYGPGSSQCPSFHNPSTSNRLSGRFGSTTIDPRLREPVMPQLLQDQAGELAELRSKQEQELREIQDSHPNEDLREQIEELLVKQQLDQISLQEKHFHQQNNRRSISFSGSHGLAVGGFERRDSSRMSNTRDGASGGGSAGPENQSLPSTRRLSLKEMNESDQKRSSRISEIPSINMRQTSSINKRPSLQMSDVRSNQSGANMRRQCICASGSKGTDNISSYGGNITDTTGTTSMSSVALNPMRKMCCKCHSKQDMINEYGLIATAGIDIDEEMLAACRQLQWDAAAAAAQRRRDAQTAERAAQIQRDFDAANAARQRLADAAAMDAIRKKEEATAEAAKQREADAHAAAEQRRRDAEAAAFAAALQREQDAQAAAKQRTADAAVAAEARRKIEEATAAEKRRKEIMEAEMKQREEELALAAAHRMAAEEEAADIERQKNEEAAAIERKLNEDAELLRQLRAQELVDLALKRQEAEEAAAAAARQRMEDEAEIARQRQEEAETAARMRREEEADALQKAQRLRDEDNEKERRRQEVLAAAALKREEDARETALRRQRAEEEAAEIARIKALKQARVCICRECHSGWQRDYEREEKRKEKQQKKKQDKEAKKSKESLKKTKKSKESLKNKHKSDNDMIQHTASGHIVQQPTEGDRRNQEPTQTTEAYEAKQEPVAEAYKRIQARRLSMNVSSCGCSCNQVSYRRPSENVQRLESSFRRPSENVQRSELSYRRPSENIQRPELSLRRLSENIQRPELSYRRPSENIQRPEISLRRLSENIQRSELSYRRPSENIQRSELSYRRPSENIQRSELSYRRPSENIQRPELSYRRPSENVQRPETSYQTSAEKAENVQKFESSRFKAKTRKQRCRDVGINDSRTYCLGCPIQ